ERRPSPPAAGRGRRADRAHGCAPLAHPRRHRGGDRGAGGRDLAPRPGATATPVPLASLSGAGCAGAPRRRPSLGGGPAVIRVGAYSLLALERRSAREEVWRA